MNNSNPNCGHIEGGSDPQPAGGNIRISSILTSEPLLKYTRGTLVAKGGMGAILNAKDVNLRREVAMKVMLDPDKAGNDKILRFIQEAQVTSQLEHPSIVPVHELGVDGGDNVFYTMKFVKGRTLSNVLRDIRDGDAQTIRNYPLSHLLTIFQKVCDAVAFAHSRCVIHRDLKPENVMIGDYGEVQVMDWGLAKVLPRKEWKEVGEEKPEAGGKSSAICNPQPATGSVHIDSVGANQADALLKTMDGMIMGTPQFMSPEQARGNTEGADERTDIYALGTILYNILTLNAPVTGTNVDEIIEKVSTGDIEKPTEYNPRRTGEPAKRGQSDDASAEHCIPLPHCPDERIPESLSAVTMKALETDPSLRYRSVKDLQAEIEAYQNGFATKAEKAGLFKQAALFFRRNKAASIGAVAVLVIGVVFGTRAVIEGRRAEQALEELRETAPTFAAQAGSLVENQKFDEAIEKIGFAIKLDDRNADYRLFLANTLQALSRLPEAVAAYRQVLALRGDAAAKTNLDLCVALLNANGDNAALSQPLESKLLDALLAQKRQADAVPLSHELKRDADTAEIQIRSRLKTIMAQPEWRSNKLKRLPDGTFHLDLKGQKLSDLSILAGLPISSLDISALSGLDLTPLHQLPLKVLTMRDTKGWSPDSLRGLALETLDLSGTEVTDLSMLQGMPLKRLNLFHVHMKSLCSLKGLPLERLDCSLCDLENFDGFEGSPLVELCAEYCPALRDISALRGLPIRNLDIYGCSHIKDLSPLSGCTALESLLFPEHISDIAFLRSLPNLKRLSNLGASPIRGPADKIQSAEDFWKKNGDRLERQAKMEKQIEKFRQGLIAQGNDPEKVPDWAFDAKGELAIYIARDLKCRDISDLRGVAVTKFTADGSDLRDISPLAGAPLHELTLFTPCLVADISPLRNAPLETLNLYGVPVSDISAVRKMPLKTVILCCPAVTDVSPLADVPTLEMVVLPQEAKNVEVLRHHPKIAMISYRWDARLRRPDLTAAEFWKKYDAGEFRREAAHRHFRSSTN